MKKVFVGTLESGEAEFEFSRKMVLEQTGVAVSHKVISNIPEFAAHQLLWSEWESSKRKFDLFVKVDADTILMRPTVLYEIAELFNDPEVSGVQIPLYDYFSCSLIAGLNAFSKEVRFTKPRHKLFADHADRNHSRVLKGSEVEHLAPAGFHCRNPSLRQSFHYGFRRALKRQDKILQLCANAWINTRDEARLWALAGAFSSRWWHKFIGFGYDNYCFERAMGRYLSDPKLFNEVEAYAFNISDQEAG